MLISNSNLYQNNISSDSKKTKRISLIELILANIIMILFLAFKINRLPPQIPLFYNRIWGEDQLADNWLIFIIPFFMTFFVSFNNYFVKTFFNENQLIKKIIFYFNLFIIVASTLIFVKIIILIT